MKLLLRQRVRPQQSVLENEHLLRFLDQRNDRGNSFFTPEKNALPHFVTSLFKLVQAGPKPELHQFTKKLSSMSVTNWPVVSSKASTHPGPVECANHEGNEHANYSKSHGQ
jgi:hypothetical protein